MSKGKEMAVVERETPDVFDEGAAGPWAMTKVDPAAELAAFDSVVNLMEKLVPASIRATRTQDWVKMGDKVYLQATGIERLAPLWGLVFGEPKVEREDLGGGEFAYVVTGPIVCRRTGVGFRGAVGGASSLDPFFDSYDEDRPSNWNDLEPSERADWREAHRIPPDPMDVRKKAVTNWMVRGGSMLTGMRGLTIADLQAQKKADGVASVEYGRGGKGGATATADLKARRTAFWNDVLRRAGGDVDLAKQGLKDVTRYDAYEKKDGTKVKAFDGATSVDSLSERALEIAEKKIKEHPALGDAAKGGE